jgi:hypothetical protein
MRLVMQAKTLSINCSNRFRDSKTNDLGCSARRAARRSRNRMGIYIEAESTAAT